MDISTYVNNYIADQGDQQFAVLAFDLNLACGPHRPPPKEDATFSFDPSKNSPSGPWCAAVTKWSKSKTLKALADQDEFSHPGHIHAEELLFHFFHHYLQRYIVAYGCAPQSVCLYTAKSPCESCNRILRTYPKWRYQVGFNRWISIPHWMLHYNRFYAEQRGNGGAHLIEERIDRQMHDDPDALRGAYINEVRAYTRANSLIPAGWYVQTPLNDPAPADQVVDMQ